MCQREVLKAVGNDLLRARDDEVTAVEAKCRSVEVR